MRQSVRVAMAVNRARLSTTPCSASPGYVWIIHRNQTCSHSLYLPLGEVRAYTYLADRSKGTRMIYSTRSPTAVRWAPRCVSVSANRSPGHGSCSGSRY